MADQNFEISANPKLSGSFDLLNFQDCANIHIDGVTGLSPVQIIKKTRVYRNLLSIIELEEIK